MHGDRPMADGETEWPVPSGWELDSDVHRLDDRQVGDVKFTVKGRAEWPTEGRVKRAPLCVRIGDHLLL